MSSSPISSSSSEPAAAAGSPYDALGDLRAPITVVLGTGTISVRQCLALTPETVLRLEQAAGQDLRIVVNGITVAFGEVAVIDGGLTIRVTDLARATSGARA